GHDEVDAAADQVSDERGKAISVPVSRAILDAQVLPFDIAMLVKAAQQSVEIRLVAIWRYRLKNADSIDAASLRARRERPRHGAAYQCDELASSHCVARAPASLSRLHQGNATNGMGSLVSLHRNNAEPPVSDGS